MKKIGILFGQEDTFPQAFIDRINSKNIEGIVAEQVTVDKVIQGEATEYAVIIDRISQDVPFYRAYLKNAAICGTTVVNNPFWWSADEKFFNNALATKIGVPVPKTVLLPSKERPDDTSDKSFRNLKFPLSWQSIFDYIGFPAFMKPHSGGGWKSVYKLENQEEFFTSYGETGQLVMMLQEAIDFDSYFRCYCIGRKDVLIMPYEPRNPHHLRYAADFDVSQELLETIEKHTLALNEALGYDFNTVEFAVKDGVPYAIDFCNPAPDADVNSVGQENFDWVVEKAANFAIETALNNKADQMNVSWGSFVQNAALKNIATVQEAVATVVEETVEEAPVVEPVIEEVVEEAPIVEVAEEAPSTEATLFSTIGTATADEKDDLKIIKGIGPKLEKTLNEIGIYTLVQVSKMTDTEYDLVDSLLKAFKGRGKRDKWAEQAQEKLAVEA